MARRVHLHVGAPKTGTTALQTRLQRNASSLLEHGVLVPRSCSGRRPAGLVLRAALELTGVRLGQDPEEIAGSWTELVEQVTAHDGSVVASHEAFVRCDEAAVARVVAELGAGAELHVVYSARDLGRQLVSGWLEGLKNGGTDHLATHLARARTGELPLRAAFDVPVVLGRWLAHLPPEQVHVVTVPPPDGDRSLLWQRFARVLGLDDAWAPDEPTRTNESVGIPEAQVLLALNRALGGSNRRGGPHQRIVRRTVVREGLVGRDSPRPEVPPAHVDWLAAEVEDWITWLTGSGVEVVGDLDELRPAAADPASYVDVDAPHPGAADAAVAALASVVVATQRSG
jgi:hypothetical protein